jgi:hypothetical protein
VLPSTDWIGSFRVQVQLFAYLLRKLPIVSGMVNLVYRLYLQQWVPRMALFIDQSSSIVATMNPMIEIVWIAAARRTAYHIKSH